MKNGRLLQVLMACIVSVFNLSFAQSTSRMVLFGTTETDFAATVTSDPHGNFYVGGITEGTLPGAKGEGNLFIRAYTPNGQDVWTRQFQGQGADDGSAEIRGLTASWSEQHLYAVGMGSDCLDAQCITSQHAGFLLQYDLSGQMIWKRKIAVSDPTTERLENISVAVVPGENDIYVAMETSRPDIGDIHSSRKINILRFDRSGEALWSKEFPIGSAGHLNSIDADSNGNLIVFGSTSAALSGAPKVGSTDLFIRVYNAKGKEVWTRQFGSKGNDTAYSAKVDSRGNIYVMGQTLPNRPLTDQTESGLFIRKYTKEGGQAWTDVFPESDTAFPYALTVDGSGDIYFTAMRTEALAGGFYVGKDTLLRVLDPDGRDRAQIPIPQASTVYGLSVNSEGFLAAVGVANAPEGQVPSTDSFIYLVRPLQ
ncbi:MAG: SBBP repeat-containing protein [Deinococcaceae bacterium]